jgi:hypothetical protein
LPVAFAIEPREFEDRFRTAQTFERQCGVRHLQLCFAGYALKTAQSFKKKAGHGQCLKELLLDVIVSQSLLTVDKYAAPEAAGFLFVIGF